MDQFERTDSSETLLSACVIKLRVGSCMSWFTSSALGLAIAADPLDSEGTVAGEASVVDEDKSMLLSSWETCVASSSSLVTVKLTVALGSW